MPSSRGHHRDRRAPVALTGYAPVAQTVVNFTLAHAHGSQFVGNGVEARFIIKTAELAGVKQDAFLGQRLLGEIRLGAVGSEDNRLNVQTVLAGELVVALVVTRNGHYRAGAVFHQHKVCRPDRNLFTGQRMNGFKAGIDAFFSIVAMSASATLVLRHSSIKAASAGLFAAACCASG